MKKAKEKCIPACFHKKQDVLVAYIVSAIVYLCVNVQFRLMRFSLRIRRITAHIVLAQLPRESI
jgi:hypothetical protein